MGTTLIYAVLVFVLILIAGFLILMMWVDIVVIVELGKLIRDSGKRMRIYFARFAALPARELDDEPLGLATVELGRPLHRRGQVEPRRHAAATACGSWTLVWIVTM